jgi:alkylhydroperoxidase family enzyme
MTSERPSQPRIAPLTTFEGEVAEILSTSMGRDRDKPLNIFATLAHHPKLFKRFNLLGGFLLNKGLLPAREREIVILRVGSNARSVYEFGQHTVIGLGCGLSEAEIAALAADDPGDGWSDTDRDLIALADELCADDCVSDATFARLAERWSEAEIIELVVCAGFYRLVSGFLNTMGVELDEGVPTWPS